MRRQPAFTLVELLVAVAVIAILATLILSAATALRQRAHGAACVSNLRQISVGLSLYAADHDGLLPFGPVAGPYGSPSNLYPSTGSPTSLISLQNGKPVGLGLVLPYLKDPHVLFCPGSDQRVSAEDELAKVGKKQAQGSYYFRHAGNTQLFDNPRAPFEPQNILLANLGVNRKGYPVRALVMDTIFNCPPGLKAFQVVSRTHHGGKFANVLYADGSVRTHNNTEGHLTIETTMADIRSSFAKIMDVFEWADRH